MEVILTAKAMETEHKFSQHPVAGVSEPTPTFYSLFVLNLPPPTHPSLSSTTWNTSLFCPFPPPLLFIYCFSFLLYPCSFLLVLLPDFIFLSSFYSSLSCQLCIIGIKVFSAKLSRNWKATTPKRQNFLQILFCSEKSSGTIHSAELYWLN